MGASPQQEVVPVREPDIQHDIQPGRLAVLDGPECWDLLRSQPVGRIAWSGSQGMSVVPVNYAVAEDEAIVLRTTPYSLLARDVADRDVAFEVDHVDAAHHEGWSVLVRGRCVRQRHTPEHPEPWVTGPRFLGLRIEVRSVSGRRVLPATGSAAAAQSAVDAFFTA